MAIIKHHNNIERLENEGIFLQKKYPLINFNFDGSAIPNKERYLFAVEGYITVPSNYDKNVVRQYKGLLTCNSKFKQQNQDLNVILTNGPLNCNNYYRLDYHKQYDEKIKGVVCLNRLYHTGRDGDILYMRDKVMRELQVEPCLCTHTYGSVPYGKPDGYKGVRRPLIPNHLEQLKLINDYLFCWCPEPMYHEMWSYDWITERIFNCFRSKTVAIYFGCYNIEDHIPNNLFIDYRKFNYDNKLLSEYLLSFKKSDYVEMVEAAYEFVLKTKISDMDDLECLLSSLK